MACKKQVCWFWDFFSNPLWQMLTKVDSKDNPKVNLLCTFIFSRGLFSESFNMKQDQTVKQRPYQGWVLSHNVQVGGLGRRNTSWLHSPFLSAPIFMHLHNFLVIKITIILYCWIGNKASSFQSSSGLSTGNWRLVYVGCLPNESNYV